MGAGDKRTRRGKIAVSSYGNSRPQQPKKAAAPSSKTAAKPKAK
ncbi:MAG: 30S ribosomal protein THX [Betaproteobacteria bacterium]|nr:30S ribosomal protein THX [Betaproteobacteria bacterium]MBL8535574.1 30S ribosomal protein THX [Betaproteobacteria bacterium]